MGDDLSPLGGSLVILAPRLHAARAGEARNTGPTARDVEVSAAESNIKLVRVIYQFGRG